ncbi:hypothetical protein G9C98_001672, partial [Cotesia typhae]
MNMLLDLNWKFFGILSFLSLVHSLPLFSSTYQVYEDKTNLATFTIDTNSTEIKIESGFLGHENVIITKLLNAEGSGNQYLAKTIPNDAFDALKNYLNISLPVGNHSNKSIPEEIFPEILVIVDYELFLILQARLFSYLLQFWNGVNLYFSTLEKPQYHLSIAGVIIPLDDQVLDFMNPTTSVNTNQQLVNYELVLFNMDSWLKVVSRLISFDSYDTYILMTPHRDGIFEESTTAGLSALGSSCSGVLYNEPHGGIIYDKGNYHGILTGAHELGHLFGANHDNGSCAIDSVMAEKESPSKKTWSECSKKQFLDALHLFSLANSLSDNDSIINEFYKFLVMGWVGGVFGGWGSFHKRTTPVPAQVYPEILAVIDHNLIKFRRHWDGITLGLTTMYGACTGVLENKPSGGVFLDDRNDPKSFVTGAHDEADFSCLDNYPNAGSNPGPTYSNPPTNFDIDLKPADIDSGYDFEKIDFNNFVPPLSGGPDWNYDTPVNSYSENSNDDTKFDFSGDFSYYDTPDQGEYYYSY